MSYTANDLAWKQRIGIEQTLVQKMWKTKVKGMNIPKHNQSMEKRSPNVIYKYPLASSNPNDMRDKELVPGKSAKFYIISGEQNSDIMQNYSNKVSVPYHPYVTPRKVLKDSSTQKGSPLINQSNYAFGGNTNIKESQLMHSYLLSNMEKEAIARTFDHRNSNNSYEITPISNTYGEQEITNKKYEKPSPSKNYIGHSRVRSKSVANTTYNAYSHPQHPPNPRPSSKQSGRKITKITKITNNNKGKTEHEERQERFNEQLENIHQTKSENRSFAGTKKLVADKRQMTPTRPHRPKSACNTKSIRGWGTARTLENRDNYKSNIELPVKSVSPLSVFSKSSIKTTIKTDIIKCLDLMNEDQLLLLKTKLDTHIKSSSVHDSDAQSSLTVENLNKLDFAGGSELHSISEVGPHSYRTKSMDVKSVCSLRTGISNASEKKNIGKRSYIAANDQDDQVSYDNHSRKSYSSTVTYLKTLEKQLNEERKIRNKLEEEVKGFRQVQQELAMLAAKNLKAKRQEMAAKNNIDIANTQIVIPSNKKVYKANFVG